MFSFLFDYPASPTQAAPARRGKPIYQKIPRHEFFRYWRREGKLARQSPDQKEVEQ